MDNENKVEEGSSLPPARRGVDMFLRDLQVEMAEKELYNLDEEFAKTKKNKSTVFWLTLTVFVAFFAVLALLITWYIQNETRKVAVNIQSFEDVNLKDVLDKSKEYEGQMRFAKRELTEINAEKASAADSIRTDYEQRITLVQASRLSQEEIDRQVRSLKAERDRALANSAAKYDAQIAEKEAEIAEIQAKIDSYDARLVQKAKEQEELLNNQQKLFDIKLQNTTDYYESLLKKQEQSNVEEIRKLNTYRESLISELKERHAEEIKQLILTYNPKTLPGDGERVMIGVTVPEEFERSFPSQNDPILVQEGILSNTEYAAQKQAFDDFSALIASLKSIPYTNAVPGALNYIEYLHAKEAVAHAGLWKRAANALTARDTEIKNLQATIRARDKTINEKDSIIRERDASVEQFMYAVSAFQKSSRENGFIIDPRNSKQVLVYVDPVMKVKAGDTGYVFRTDDNYIGMVRFLELGAVSKAEVIELADPEKQILPFDKILLNIK